MTKFDREIRLAQLKDILSPQKWENYLFVGLMLFTLVFSLEISQKEIPRCTKGDDCLRDFLGVPPKYEYHWVFTPAHMIWQKISMFSLVAGVLYRKEIQKRMKS